MNDTTQSNTGNTEGKVKGNVNLICCGGGGTNMGYRLERLRGIEEPGFANLSIAYVDTSRSNLRKDIPSERCYIVEGMDGSGQLRNENDKEIAKRTAAILQRFKPADLTIVISTGAGGSGSVIAPLLTRELLNREAPTIVILVGGRETRRAAINTLNTIKSYAKISDSAAKPIIISYIENSPSLSPAMIDKIIEGLVSTLLAAYSRENHALDSRDLFNWINFHRSTTFNAQLAALSLVDSGDFPDNLGAVISVTTLTTPNTPADFPIVPDIHFIGYVPENMSAKAAERAKVPMHLIISDGIVGEAAESLGNFLNGLDEEKSARLERKSILSSKDEANDNDLVM